MEIFFKTMVVKHSKGRTLTLFLIVSTYNYCKKQESAESIQPPLFLKKGMSSIFNVTSSPTLIKMSFTSLNNKADMMENA